MSDIFQFAVVIRVRLVLRKPEGNHTRMGSSSLKAVWLGIVSTANRKVLTAAIEGTSDWVNG